MTSLFLRGTRGSAGAFLEILDGLMNLEISRKIRNISQGKQDPGNLHEVIHRKLLSPQGHHFF
jgi:hypothetical protein